MKRPGGSDRRDKFSALFFLAFSLLICIASLSTLSYGHYHLPGPGFLPFWSGVLLGLISLGILVKSIMQKEKMPESFFHRTMKKPLYTLLVLIAYGLLFRILGYLLCNFLFIALMFLILERKKWYVALGGGSITALAFYLIFGIWLRVPLPKGIFEIF